MLFERVLRLKFGGGAYLRKGYLLGGLDQLESESVSEFCGILFFKVQLQALLQTQDTTTTVRTEDYLCLVLPFQSQSPLKWKLVKSR